MHKDFCQHCGEDILHRKSVTYCDYCGQELPSWPAVDIKALPVKVLAEYSLEPTAVASNPKDSEAWTGQLWLRVSGKHSGGSFDCCLDCLIKFLVQAREEAKQGVAK